MIKKYKREDGSTTYVSAAYLGVDPITHKQKRATRRGFETEGETKIVETKLQAEVQTSGFLNTEIVTFKQIYELWLGQYRNTVKESTYQQAIATFKMMILPHFKDIAIKDVTVPHCQRVVNEWYRTYSETKEERIYASTIFEYAISLRIITDNPFNHIKTPREKNNQRHETMRYYTSDELQRFLELVKDNVLYHASSRTLVFTGIKRDELMALIWNDIDFTNQTLNMNKALAGDLNHRQFTDTPETRSSVRTIDVDGKTLEVLEGWRTQQRVSSLRHGRNASDRHQEIFTNIEANKRLNRVYANETLNLMCKKDNPKRVTVHGFRHTHCSLLFEAGLSVQETQGRLGHGGTQTTMGIYTHVIEEQRKKVAEKFANYVSS